MAKVGISHCFDMDRLGHAGVKVKWEPVEARHGVNAQADAQVATRVCRCNFGAPAGLATKVAGSSPDGAL